MYGANLAGLLDGPARWAPRAAGAPGRRARPQRTWAELAEAVARRAGGLRERHGIGPGDAVALFASNHPAYLEALFSIWHAGAVAVPISSRLHPREAADVVDRGHARLCFCTADVGRGLSAEAEVPVLVFGEEEDAALAAAEPAAPVARQAADDAWTFFTSGTTGKPKGARLSPPEPVRDVGRLPRRLRRRSAPADSMIHVAAFSHASGLMALPFLARGAAQVLPPSGGFDADELFGLIAAGERSTFFVPPGPAAPARRPPRGRLGRGRRSGRSSAGAAPVGPGELRDAVAALGPVVWNGYGQGESPCTITANGKAAIAAAVAAGDEDCLRSVGVARLGLIVRVVDAEDRELAAGEVGEVVVDGPTVMAGYLDMPEATAADPARRPPAHRRPRPLRRAAVGSPWSTAPRT